MGFADLFFFFLEQFFPLSFAKLLGLAVAGFFLSFSFSFSISNVRVQGRGEKRKKERKFSCFSLTGTSVGEGIFLIFKLMKENALRVSYLILAGTKAFVLLYSRGSQAFPPPPKGKSNNRLDNGRFFRPRNLAAAL
jgi:hypothetical protein